MLNDLPPKMFSLIESAHGPSETQPYRRALADNETIRSDFIGASTHQCQQWALEKQKPDRTAEKNLIAIADERSSCDDTLLMQYYAQYSGPFGERDELIPSETDKWYDFRVHYNEADAILVALKFGAPDINYPQFFGRKEELTDENGIFNTVKAMEPIGGIEAFQRETRRYK